MEGFIKPFRVTLGEIPAVALIILYQNRAWGLLGLSSMAFDDEVPLVFRMPLSRARFFSGARSRDTKYMKTCPRAFEGIAGKPALPSSLQSGGSSSPVPARRSSGNGWKVCGMSCPATCHPSTSSVRSRDWGWFFWLRAERGFFTWAQL